MIDIKNQICSIKPRESSGSSSSNRFDFQKDWAICKILELHECPDDYLLTLEHHDDIIIFDSCSNPQKISFYQVKTNNAQHWTLNSLVKQKEGKNGLLNSHLGKLFHHIQNFGDSVSSLNFVTNNKIKAKLKDDSKCEDTMGFRCADLCDDDLNVIIEKLKKEHALNNLGNFKDITFFKLGELSIDKHSTITKGKLSEFIDKNFPLVKYQIAPLYKSIFDEIRIKSNVEHSILDFNDLKKYKSISREDFDSYFKVLTDLPEMKDNAVKIENRLNSEGADFKLLREFKRYSKVYEVQKMTYNDKNLLRVIKEVDKIIVEKESCLNGKLIDCMNIIFDELDLKRVSNNTINDEFIKTIILFQLYE